MDVWEGIDIEVIDIPLLEMLYEEYEYKDHKKIYWLEPGLTLEEELRELKSDNDLHMLLAAIKNVMKIHFLH